MKTSPAALIRQVKQETAKITWPTRKEAMQMTIAVIVMSLIFAAFFWFIDGFSKVFVGWILGV